MQNVFIMIFKVLHPNRKCTAAVKCFSSQNGRIMFYSVLFQIKKNAYNNFSTRYNVHVLMKFKNHKNVIFKKMLKNTLESKFQVFGVF